MKSKYIYIFFLTIIILLLAITPKLKNQESISNNNKLLETTGVKVKVEKENSTIELDLEEYVVGVLGCEMPALFEEEALKAGAVAARTYVLNKIQANENKTISSTTNDQCYSTNEELANKWQENYQQYFQKIEKAVENTSGEYMTYEDNIIKAYYFSTSNGYTENVAIVFGETLDYLVSVESPYDENTKQFYSKVIINKEEFLNKLNLKETNIKIGNITRTESKRVETITINDKIYTGIEIRKLLNLRSTDFDISIAGNEIEIATKGYGHGVGMSQYGANELAKIGYAYDEILKHYYSGIKIVK